MPDNEPTRLPLGEHFITIDPQTQYVTISGTIYSVRLSFEDAYRLLGILFDQRDVLSRARHAHEEPQAAWAHPNSPSEVCYICRAPVCYIEMGNGEEAVLPICACCEQFVCSAHSFTDARGSLWCVDPRCQGYADREDEDEDTRDGHMEGGRGTTWGEVVWLDDWDVPLREAVSTYPTCVLLELKVLYERSGQLSEGDEARYQATCEELARRNISAPDHQETTQANTLYTCYTCGRPLSFPEAFWWQGISYCAQHLPESHRYASEGWDP